jgi:hypothetical protein
MTTLGEVVTAQLKLRPFKTAFFKAPDNGSPAKLKSAQTREPSRVGGFSGSIANSEA